MARESTDHPNGAKRKEPSRSRPDPAQPDQTQPDLDQPQHLAAGDIDPATVTVDEVRAIVAEEFAARVSAVHAARVAPTVVALRTKAAKVVDAELARLAGRLPADHRTLDEVERAMRRVVDKLLHAPTVRVKELAGSPGADSYELALRVLFDLDPAAVQAVTRADAGLVPWPGEDAAQ